MRFTFTSDTLILKKLQHLLDILGFICSYHRFMKVNMWWSFSVSIYKTLLPEYRCILLSHQVPWRLIIYVKWILVQPSEILFKCSTLESTCITNQQDKHSISIYQFTKHVDTMVRFLLYNVWRTNNIPGWLQYFEINELEDRTP